MTAALTQRVSHLVTTVGGLRARREAVGLQLSTARKTMLDLETRKAHLIKCTAVLDKLTQEVARKGVGRVEQVVTQGLQVVFGPNVSCILEKKEGARGTTYAIKLKVVTAQGEVIGDPMDSFGGGPVNITAFLFRVLMIHRFKLARLLVLDETFNNVSREYLRAVSSLLKTLVEDHGYQILAVTHQPELAAQATKAYRVSGEIGDPTLHCLTVGEEA